MHFASFVLAALAVAVPAHAMVAWSGDSCNGDRGNSVPCDGSCHSFAGRHSFVAETDGGACVSFFTAGGCGGGRFNFSGQGRQCTNVNTGTAIESFACWSNGGCGGQGDLPGGGGRH